MPCKYTIKTEKLLFPYSFLNFTQKSVKMQQKRIYDKTPYVWENKFTPGKKILHNRWL